MDNKILKLEDKIQEQNRLIGVLTRQNKEKDREIKYLKTQISRQNTSKARDLEEHGAILKKRIQRDFKKTAYFVKEPEISVQTREALELKTEINREETPETIMMRLRYKIDRGEYNHAETVYAQKVWNIITDRSEHVPENIKQQRKTEQLKRSQTKTALDFDNKFNTQKILNSHLYEEIHHYLKNDLKRRALIEPLIQFPNDLIREIEIENKKLLEENIVDLQLVKTEKNIKRAEENDDKLQDLLPEVLNHFNPMAEAELALLDEEISKARKANSTTKTLERKSEINDIS